MHIRTPEKSERIVFIILLSVVIIFLAAGQLLAATEITGDVWDGKGGPLTLAGSPYFSKGGFPVPKDKTLTIHPGVEIRIAKGWGISVQGTLIAKGTATQKITFTSDGDKTPGWWVGIEFLDGSSGILEHCNILYGGNWKGGNIICQGNSAPIISNCQISYSSVDGIRAEGKSRARVVNCIISNNKRAAFILQSTANFGDFSGNNVTGNELNAIRLNDPPGGFPIYEPVTLRNFNIPYNGININVNKGAKLTIEPGVIIKFDGDTIRETTGHLTVYDGGVLEARGLPCEPIVLTYIKDDIGGDTNGDGNASAPERGTWNGVTFQNGSSGILEYCKILYAGHPWSRGVGCEGNASPTISNCEFSHLKGIGVYARDNANPVVSPNNMFTDITEWGVYNQGSSTINATNNWWGSASGPQHKTNPGGGPLKVSDKVNFTPYLNGLPNYSNSICLSVVAAPAALPADGVSVSTIYVWVWNGAGQFLSGQNVQLSLSQNLGRLSSVSDRGDGSYTATFAASTTIGTEVVTASVGNASKRAYIYLYDPKLAGGGTVPPSGGTEPPGGGTTPPGGGGTEPPGGGTTPPGGGTTPPSGQITLIASPSVVGFGGTITVQFSGVPADADDMITMRNVNEINPENVNYDSRDRGGRSDGTVTFTAPNWEGKYEFHIHDSGWTRRLATSNIVEVKSDTTPGGGTTPPGGGTTPPGGGTTPPGGGTTPPGGGTTPPGGGQAVLTAYPDVVTSGDKITVIYLGAPGNAQDWIAMYPSGSSQWVSYQYLNGNVNGTIYFTAPATAGNYEFRMLPNNQAEPVLAVSNTVTVKAQTGGTTPPGGGTEPPGGGTTPPGGGGTEPPGGGTTPPGGGTTPPSGGTGSPVFLVAYPVSVEPSGVVTVMYSGAPGNATDWVAMYAQGASDSQFLSWQYLNGNRSGMFYFQAPATAGTYNFRMFGNNQISPVLAVSNNVTVAVGGGVNPSILAYPSTVSPGDLIVVSYSNAPADELASIEMYAVNASGAGYLPGDFLYGNRNGALIFSAPEELGQYAFRMLDGQDQPVAQSNVVTVVSRAPGTVPQPFLFAYPGIVAPDDMIMVAYSGAPSEDDAWIGMFKPGTGDSSPVDMDFMYDMGSGTLYFLAPMETGNYEFRMFNAQNQRLAVSNTVTVTTGSTTPPVGGNTPGGGAVPPGGGATPPGGGTEPPGGGTTPPGGGTEPPGGGTEPPGGGTTPPGGGTTPPGGGTTPPSGGRMLIIPEVNGNAGQLVTVPINITDASGVAGADITVLYDRNILTVGNVKSTTLSGAINLVANTGNLGKIIIRMAGNAIASGSGAFVDMEFTVSNSAANGTETPVTFEEAFVYDAQGLDITIGTQNGKVIIGGVSCLKGDVNGDGAVRSNDAILALRISAQLMTPTALQLCAADMNNDGVVRSNDAILILRKSAGLLAPSKPLAENNARKITVSLDVNYDAPGKAVIVPLKIDLPEALAGGDICIGYDSSVLRAVDVSSEEDVLISANLIKAGKILIAFADSGKLSDNTLAKIEFDVIGQGSSNLAFQGLELYGHDALPVKSRGIDGEFISHKMRPDESALLQNFPNPFNPETWIPYKLREGGEVTINIYDSNGKLLRELKPGYKPAGSYIDQKMAAYWDGKDESGVPVASGVYFYSIKAGDLSHIRKMIVLR